ncbi:MAG: hypothetical protein WCV86_03485 [Patescibacteria group bacterium]|jgi:hypothetical protein
MKALIITLVVTVVLIMIGGAVYLLSDALNPEELAINTTIIENTNTAAPANINAGPGTTPTTLTMPADYPADVYRPSSVEVLSVNVGADSTTVGMLDMRTGKVVLAELRAAMTSNAWTEDFAVSEDTRTYTGTWTKGGTRITFFMQLVNETDDTANTSIELTY